MVGYGGVCHLIADEMVNLLYENDIDCTTISSDYAVHVYVVCKLEEGVFKVDIPYSLYETGGGYTWKKIENVSFNEDGKYNSLFSIKCLIMNNNSFSLKPYLPLLEAR